MWTPADLGQHGCNEGGAGGGGGAQTNLSDF